MKLEYKVVELTEKDIADFLSLEACGWDYWGCLDYQEKEYHQARVEMLSVGWNEKLICYENVLAYMLTHGYKLYVADEDERHKLTVDKLKRGIELNAQERPFDSDWDNMDTTMGDCILQYAIFGELIYG